MDPWLLRHICIANWLLRARLSTRLSSEWNLFPCHCGQTSIARLVINLITQCSENCKNIRSHHNNLILDVLFYNYNFQRAIFNADDSSQHRCRSMQMHFNALAKSGLNRWWFNFGQAKSWRWNSAQKYFFVLNHGNLRIVDGAEEEQPHPVLCEQRLEILMQKDLWRKNELEMSWNCVIVRQQGFGPALGPRKILFFCFGVLLKVFGKSGCGPHPPSMKSKRNYFFK